MAIGRQISLAVSLLLLSGAVSCGNGDSSGSPAKGTDRAGCVDDLSDQGVDPLSTMDLAAVVVPDLLGTTARVANGRFELTFETDLPLPTEPADVGPTPSSGVFFSLFVHDREGRPQVQISVGVAQPPPIPWQVFWRALPVSNGNFVTPFDLAMPLDEAEVSVENGESSGSVSASWPLSAGPAIPNDFLWGSQSNLVTKTASYDPFTEHPGPDLYANGFDSCPEAAIIGHDPWDGSELTSFPNRATVAVPSTTLAPPPTIPATTIPASDECNVDALEAAVAQVVADDPYLQSIGAYQLVNVGCKEGYAKVGLIDDPNVQIQGITFLLRWDGAMWNLLNEDYDSGVCSTDAATYDIPPDVWDAIGGNHIVAC